MDYCIKNNREVYIKLDSNGTPVSCVKSVMGVFEFSKAKNIVENLPKSLKRMGFKVEAIPEILTKEETEDEVKVLIKENYILSDSISRWLERFTICDAIIKEARKRKEELYIAIGNANLELTDRLHKIELEKSKNAFLGYNEYKLLKELLEKRRNLKDEYRVVCAIIKMYFRNFDIEKVENVILKLNERKYSFRLSEEDDDNEDM